MGAMSPWHWAIVLIVLVLLFGSTRLPGAARGLGRSLRIFKSEMREMTSDDTPRKDDPAPAPQALPAQPPAPQVDPAAQVNAAAQPTPQQQAAPQSPQAQTPPQAPPAQGTGA